MTLSEHVQNSISELLKESSQFNTNDVLVFIDDGSYASKHDSLSKYLNEKSLTAYFIDSHLEARGLKSESLTIISIDRLTQLIIANERVITWK